MDRRFQFSSSLARAQRVIPRSPLEARAPQFLANVVDRRACGCIAKCMFVAVRQGVFSVASQARDRFPIVKLH